MSKQLNEPQKKCLTLKKFFNMQIHNQEKHDIFTLTGKPQIHFALQETDFNNKKV